MPVIVREGSWRIWIHTDDHGRPHVHVHRRGARAKILLPTAGAPAAVLSRRAMTDHDAVAAVALVEVYAEELVSAWRRIHGFSETD
jgi:hypothetical protein